MSRGALALSMRVGACADELRLMVVGATVYATFNWGVARFVCLRFLGLLLGGVAILAEA